MNRHDFLVEIGAEEMPPKSLVALGEAFRDGVVAGLAEAGLSHGAVQAYFTPRRLAVGVQKLLDRQPEQRIERRGPPIAAAFDAAGKPTRAATAFAESCGVKVEELTRIDDNKGQFLFCRTTRPGEAAARLLPGIVQACPEIPVMLDGGIRRGTDVLKALALGARFVFAGRPFAFAAAVAGEAGVGHAIRLLGAEVSRNMAMLGLTDLEESAQLRHVQRAHGAG